MQRASTRLDSTRLTSSSRQHCFFFNSTLSVADPPPTVPPFVSISVSSVSIVGPSVAGGEGERGRGKEGKDRGVWERITGVEIEDKGGGARKEEREGENKAEGD